MICGREQLQFHGGGAGAAEGERAAGEFYRRGAGAELRPGELGQSASSWAAAGARRRKAGRTSGASNAGDAARGIVARAPALAAHPVWVKPVSSPSPPPAAKLLSWYAAHRRHLPWRAAPGQTADPYHVWLSEIMLQQTVVATVIPYYAKFLAAYPTVTRTRRGTAG